MTKRDSDMATPWSAHLSFYFSSIRVRRENYYSGQISGVPCQILKSRISSFCTLFFETSLSDCCTAQSLILSVNKVSDSLQILGNLFTGSNDGSTKRYLIRFLSKSKWSDYMTEDFNSASNGFVQKLKSVQRPPAV